MQNSIIIIGTGGQGIKLLAHILGQILQELGKTVSIHYEYDAAMRGGKITSFLTFGNKKILNPIIEEADILLNFTNQKQQDYKAKLILEEKQLKFEKEATEKLKNKRVANMIALGKLLEILKIDLKKITFKKILPEKFRETNIKAIKLGYKT